MAKHIMVINDTQEILQLFYDILTPEGYDVSLHSFGMRDLEEVRRIKPDLIVSDHPPFQEEKGWQLVQKVRMSSDTTHIPILICTTNLKWLRTNVDEGFLTAKGIAVLGKPFDVEELLQQIATLIGDPTSNDTGTLLKGLDERPGSTSTS